MKIAGLLERYEEMLALSQQMLGAAQQGEWDRLIEVEQTRAAVETVLQREDTGLWDAKNGIIKQQLIRAILAQDQEVKKLAESWIGDLQNNLGSIDMARKLKKAYGSP